MTTGAESLSPSSPAEHVPIEELARRQGVQPVESLAILHARSYGTPTRNMSGFSPTSTRPADPAWRELRRSGHRCCVGDHASALAWFDGGAADGAVVGDHIRDGGGVDLLDFAV